MKKFRPYLTERQILRILMLCSKEPATDPEIQGIKRALSIFSFKIQEDLVDPAYTESPRQSIEEKLGFTSGSLAISDPVTARKMAWEKYCSQIAECTEREIALAFTYKYEAGLMTDEERTEYENKMLG